MEVNIIIGYASIRISTPRERAIYMGFIQGNIPTRIRRYSHKKALQDAKKLYNRKI